MCAINIFGVKWFGEAEFFFSIIKSSSFTFLHNDLTNRHVLRTVFLITLLIITGLVVDLGGGPNHDRIGFRVSPTQMNLMSELTDKV